MSKMAELKSTYNIIQIYSYVGSHYVVAVGKLRGKKNRIEKIAVTCTLLLPLERRRKHRLAN